MYPVRALANLVYPPACLLCHARLPMPRNLHADLARQARLPSSEPVFCEPCASTMPRLGPPICGRCGLGLSGAFDARFWCASCQANPLAFDLARSPWWYAGTVQEAIRQFKYHRRWRIGRLLADAMATVARSSLPLDEVDAVLPVPPHWIRRRLRGFHPAALLAETIAQSLEKPHVPHTLSRSRWTPTQTHLQWRRRFRNVQGAFRAHQPSADRRTFLLVDDVLTSGATAHACALALKGAGARGVFVLTAARTPFR